jgi:NADPH:quinone reductase-like Zn-dependent oxidoreductase
MWLTLAHALTPRTVYTMPKIVRFHQVGGPEVLKLEELPAPKPQKGEVLIKVDAIGLNRAESMFRSGHYLLSARTAFWARVRGFRDS